LFAESRKAKEATQVAEQTSKSFSEYKTRAHELLKAKEEELKEIRLAAKSIYQEEMEEYKRAADQAHNEISELKKKQEEHEKSSSKEIQEVRRTYNTQLTERDEELRKARESSKASHRQYEQMRVRLETYEERINSLKAQLDEARSELAAGSSNGSETEALRQELNELRVSMNILEKERDSLIDMRAVMETEVSDLKGTIKQLRRSMSIRAAMSQPDGISQESHANHNIASDTFSPRSSEVDTAKVEKLNDEILIARRRLSEAEHEVDDLEREVALRNTQEIALKEAVREMERELERVKLASKQGTS